MFSRFVRRQTIWWPTLWGWATLFLLIFGTVGLWAWQAEPFLALTKREPADVLVVEGWISIEGIRKAAEEFHSQGYKIAVTTGGLSGRSWTEERFSYAEIAREELIRAGVPSAAIIVAPPTPTENQRTYEMALAAHRMLQKNNIPVQNLNVFTRGAHGRRSRSVYSKVFGASTHVGVIAWRPPGEEASIPWWESSARTQELVKETVAYLFEVLLDSGRSVVPPSPRNS